MKKFLLPLILIFALICVALPASADNPGNYCVIKGGRYSPSDTHDLDNFNSGNSSHLDSETGFNGELAVGHYFLPIFAVELGAGYFESKGSPAAEPGNLKLKVVPVTATAKVFLSIWPIEPYAELGIGSYFTKLDVDGNLGNFSGSSEVTYGLHAGAGANLNITKTVFIGFEVRYLWSKPSYGGQDITLNGFTNTAGLGFRF